MSKVFCVVREGYNKTEVVDICASLLAAQYWCKHLNDSSYTENTLTVKPMPVVGELEAYLVDCDV